MKTTRSRGYFAKLGLGAGVAVALGGAPVVAHAEDNMPSSPSTAIESGSAAASGAATGDSSITDAVKGKLAKAGSDASDIKVDTDKGLVTLSGTVHSPSTRDSAGKMANRVEGVERVKNDIEVLPAK